jgi:predicted esterase
MKEVPHFFLKTERTARVAYLGAPGQEIADCWIVLHGYRMLANRFLYRFREMEDEQTLIVAPEGLSRFYLRGHKLVGASWMTKEDRLHEIEDQWRYLNLVQETLAQQLPRTVRWHLLGFSQGLATVWRWVKNGRPRVNSLTLWTGKIPEETSPELETVLSQLPLCYVYGSNDEFIPEKLGLKQGRLFQTQYPHLHIERFEGPHDVLPGTLRRIKAQIMTHF